MSRSHHNRFFLRPEDIESETFSLSGDELKHLQVKRIKIGDIVAGIDGAGKEYRGEVYFLRRNMVVCHILETMEHRPPADRIILGLGIIKSAPLSFAVEKAVELGALEIAIVKTEHSERELKPAELQRLERIAISAMKQSGGVFLTAISACKSPEELLNRFPGACSFYADPDGINILRAGDFRGQNVIMVGPEGGFSQKESALMNKMGALPVSLGKNRLRAETAAVAALAGMMFRQGGSAQPGK